MIDGLSVGFVLVPLLSEEGGSVLLRCEGFAVLVVEA